MSTVQRKKIKKRISPTKGVSIKSSSSIKSNSRLICFPQRVTKKSPPTVEFYHEAAIPSSGGLSGNYTETKTPSRLRLFKWMNTIEHIDHSEQLGDDIVDWNLGDIIWEATRMKSLGIDVRIEKMHNQHNNNNNTTGLSLQDSKGKLLKEPENWIVLISNKGTRKGSMNSIHKWMLHWNRMGKRLDDKSLNHDMNKL